MTHSEVMRHIKQHMPDTFYTVSCKALDYDEPRFNHELAICAHDDNRFASHVWSAETKAPEDFSDVANEFDRWWEEINRVCTGGEMANATMIGCEVEIGAKS